MCINIEVNADNKIKQNQKPHSVSEIQLKVDPT